MDVWHDFENDSGFAVVNVKNFSFDSYQFQCANVQTRLREKRSSTGKLQSRSNFTLNCVCNNIVVNGAKNLNKK